MSRRVTIRLGDEDYAKLQNRCQAMNLDTSFVVKEALGRYFSDSGTTSQEAKPASTSQVMPAEGFERLGPYRAWSGDLRAELRKRLLEMLALSYATAEQFPRTKGVREVYIAVLDAYYLLNGVGHER
ncbi:MAG: hypothetical protein LAP85_22295 [Acidobacteriia bacterium]|nr:hypothetical protein [Terriglobia bacterium]